MLRVRLSEPGLIEARTEVSAEGVWDYGPDAFLGFERSDLALRLSAQRPFLHRALFATLGLQHDRFLVADDASTSDGSPVPDSYYYSFVDQELRVDLRDDQTQPRTGAFFSLLTSLSVRAPFSDWTLLRLIPTRACTSLALAHSAGSALRARHAVRVRSARDLDESAE